MKSRQFYLLVLCYLLIGKAVGQPSGWTLNPNAYQYTMNAIALPLIDSLQQPGIEWVAVFAGDECRGVAPKDEDSGLFFLTVYANASGEALTIKAYHESLGQVLEASNRLVFSPNDIVGSSADPFMAYFPLYNDRPPFLSGLPDREMEEGESWEEWDLRSYLQEYDGDDLLWEASSNQSIAFELSAAGGLLVLTWKDPYWHGMATIAVSVTDKGTEQGFSATDTLLLTVRPKDSPVSIGALPAIVAVEGEAFPSVDLTPHIVEHDGDHFVLSVQAQAPLEATLNQAGVLAVASGPDWFGEAIVEIIAQDQGTASQLVTRQPIVFRKTGIDDAPELLSIPPVVTNASTFFATIDLRNFLREVDGDAVAWKAIGGLRLNASITSEGICLLEQKDPMWQGTDSLVVSVADVTSTGLFSEQQIYYISGDPLGLAHWPAAAHAWATAQPTGIALHLEGLPLQGQASLYNAQGQLVGYKEVASKPQGQTIYFPIPPAPSGIYLIQIMLKEGGVKVLKIWR